MSNGQKLKEMFVEEVERVLGHPSDEGGEAVVQPLEVTDNGTYTAPSGVDGYSPVKVNVPKAVVTVPPILKELEVTENGTYEPSYADGFSNVTVNVQPELQEKTAKSNGEVTPDSGYDGLSKVIVDIPSVKFNTDDLVARENKTYTAKEQGVDGFSSVTVAVPGDEFKAAELTATENKTYTPDEGVDGFSSVIVNVQPELQEKNVTSNGEVIPDSGYDGLSKVIVDVPSKEPTLQVKTVTENGEVTPDSGYDGLAKVIVNVPQSSSGDVSTYDDTYILVTPSGQEIAAVFVDEQTEFDATAEDIREGKVAATESGITVGTLSVS